MEHSATLWATVPRLGDCRYEGLHSDTGVLHTTLCYHKPHLRALPAAYRWAEATAGRHAACTAGCKLSSRFAAEHFEVCGPTHLRAHVQHQHQAKAATGRHTQQAVDSGFAAENLGVCGPSHLRAHVQHQHRAEAAAGRHAQQVVRAAVQVQRQRQAARAHAQHVGRHQRLPRVVAHARRNLRQPEAVQCQLQQLHPPARGTQARVQGLIHQISAQYT